MIDTRKRGVRSGVLLGGLSAAMVVGVAANGAFAATAPPKPAAPVSNSACPATPGVTPTTVNYGFISPTTGAAAPNFVGGAQAARLRIDQENAKGGVNGRKIIFKAYDDASSSTTFISVVNQAIGDNMFGVSTDTSTAGGYQSLAAAGIPVTGFNAQSFGQDRNAFGVTGATVPPGIGSLLIIQKLKALGVTKVANINHSSAGASASGNTTAGLLTLVPGISQSLRIADEPQGTHDATSTALRVKNSGSDGAIIVGFTDGAVSIAQALKQQGVTLKGTYVAGLSDPAVLRSTGTALDGMIGVGAGTVPIGVPNAAVRTYSNGMKSAGLNPYATYGPIGYLGADLFIRGLKEAGKCPTRALFIDKLRNVTNYNGGGLVPERISFKPGLTPNGNPAVCTWYLVAKGTELVPDKAATCGATYVDTATGKVVFQG